MGSLYLNKDDVLKLIKAFGEAKAAGDEVRATKLYNEIIWYMNE